MTENNEKKNEDINIMLGNPITINCTDLDASSDYSIELTEELKRGLYDIILAFSMLADWLAERELDKNIAMPLYDGFYV